MTSNEGLHRRPDLARGYPPPMLVLEFHPAPLDHANAKRIVGVPYADIHNDSVSAVVRGLMVQRRSTA